MRQPRADYVLFSDRHRAALVGWDGSVDWLCFPRFDRPSILGRVLGGEFDHRGMGAASAAHVTRYHLDHTKVAQTPSGRRNGCGAPR
jgi:GH15 family glucan-1,4-alpha-glucosidase